MRDSGTREGWGGAHFPRGDLRALGHLLIVASERDELTLVRLEGSFDGLLEAALSGHTLKTLGHAVDGTPEVEKDDEDID